MTYNALERGMQKAIKAKLDEAEALQNQAAKQLSAYVTNKKSNQDEKTNIQLVEEAYALLKKAGKSLQSIAPQDGGYGSDSYHHLLVRNSYLAAQCLEKFNLSSAADRTKHKTSIVTVYTSVLDAYAGCRTQNATTDEMVRRARVALVAEYTKNGQPELAAKYEKMLKEKTSAAEEKKAGDEKKSQPSTQVVEHSEKKQPTPTSTTGQVRLKSKKDIEETKNDISRIYVELFDRAMQRLSEDVESPMLYFSKQFSSKPISKNQGFTSPTQTDTGKREGALLAAYKSLQIEIVRLGKANSQKLLPILHAIEALILSSFPSTPFPSLTREEMAKIKASPKQALNQVDGVTAGLNALRAFGDVIGQSLTGTEDFAKALKETTRWAAGEHNAIVRGEYIHR